MFEIYKIFLIIVFSIIIFIWIFRLKTFNSKIFFSLFLLAFLTYSGIGGGLKGINEHYFTYYAIYAVFLSIGLFIGKGREEKYNRNKQTKERLIKIINKYGKTIIIVFFLIKLVQLIYPQLLLHRLIFPPAPDLTSTFLERFETKELTFFESISYYLVGILTPFFFLSLYKYKEKPLPLIFILLAIPYLDYCRIGYIGRANILLYLFVISLALYKFKPKLRIPLVISFSILLPTLIIFMANYTYIRLGETPSIKNTFVALEALFYSESYYPLWFGTIYNEPFEINNLTTYLKWLFTLPIPGFLKANAGLKGDEIAGLLLGVEPGKRGFYIVLPGLVGESVYYFGKYLFWIHSLLTGLLVGYVYRLLNRYDQMNILLFYATFQLTYFINRAGTGSGFPLILKVLLTFFIIIYLYSRYNIKINYEK